MEQAQDLHPHNRNIGSVISQYYKTFWDYCPYKKIDNNTKLPMTYFKSTKTESYFSQKQLAICHRGVLLDCPCGGLNSMGLLHRFRFYLQLSGIKQY